MNKGFWSQLFALILGPNRKSKIQNLKWAGSSLTAKDNVDANKNQIKLSFGQLSDFAAKL